MPRNRDRYTPVEPLKVTLPTPVARAFRHALHDPLRSRMRYGAASTILTGLIRDWLRDHGFPEELHTTENEHEATQ